jgi:GNAT superfamily N-acetyltransferase
MDALPIAIEISRFDQCGAPDTAWSQVAAIFFSSSATKDFASAADRARHLDTWTQYYRVCEPELFFVARARPEKADPGVVGYIMGCGESAEAPTRGLDLPSYALFEPWFSRFPAHCHINLQPSWRGAGLGGRLINRLCVALRARGVEGVHVVTAFGARNVQFYRRCGFQAIAIRPFRERDLLFLGRRL